MSRFTSLLTLTRFSSGPTLGLDIGNQVTKAVYQRRVIKEPTILVYQESSKEVISIGKKADQQADLLTRGLLATKPLKEGRIKDSELFSKYIEQLSANVIKKKETLSMPFSVPVMVAVPLNQTQVQAQAYSEALHQAHLQVKSLVPSSSAVFALAQKENLIGTTACLLDLGAELTQLSIYISGELFFTQILPFGGKKITLAIQQLVRNRHHCEVSWHTAEKIKVEIGTLGQHKKENIPHLVVRGRSIISNTPQSITLQATQFSEALLALSQEWLEEIKVALGHIPGPQLSEVLENGLLLYGGSALLRGIVPFMEDGLHAAVNTPERPQTAIVEGLHYVEN